MSTAAQAESVYGSLIWWKDDASAVFPGIGEVQRYGWVDGSARLCSSPAFTCLQCPSVELPGYSGVLFMPPGGGSYPMVQDSGDHWHYAYPLAGDTFDVQLTCGSQQSGCTSFSLKGQAKAIVYQEPYLLDHSTHTYKFHTYTNVPGAWPGGDTLFQLVPGFTPPDIFTHGWHKANTAGSVTVTWPVSIPSGKSVLYLVFQHGVDISGGTLTTPPVLSGGTVLLGSSDFRITLIYAPTLAPGTTTVFPISSAADICWVSAYVISGTFAGVLDTHTVLVNQPTTLNPAITCPSPATSPGIQLYGIMTWRTALSSATVPVPNTYTIMDTNNGPDNSNVAGGTPLFEGAGLASGGQKYSSTPFTGATCHTVTSEKFNAMFANLH